MREGGKDVSEGERGEKGGGRQRGIESRGREGWMEGGREGGNEGGREGGRERKERN